MKRVLVLGKRLRGKDNSAPRAGFELIVPLEKPGPRANPSEVPVAVTTGGNRSTRS